MSPSQAQKFYAIVFIFFFNIIYSSGEGQRPLIIAHRGASGTIPEHTQHAYEKAIAEGADYIECDVTITKDLQLICSHQSWLKEVTDVEEKFPERNTTRYGISIVNISSRFSNENY